LVQAFVNTRNPETGHDTLQAADALRAWLREGGLLRGDERISAQRLRRALELREAFRSAMLANNGGPDAPSAVDTLNDLARRAHLRVHFHGDHGDIEPGITGVDGALGWILAVAVVSMIEGSWYRLKACPRCLTVFYDHSKNRSGTWCSMSVCGNRMKAGTYRRRQKEARVRQAG
jgi:predicted RNA-binding Zn ribbon-like protein